MITTRTLLAGVAGAALLAGVAASNADAATIVSIETISATWQNTIPGVSGTSTADYAEIRWGTPASTGGEQSGYRFTPEDTPFTVPADGTTVPPEDFDPPVPFDIGIFTHFNFPITGDSLTQADLVVEFQVALKDNGTISTQDVTSTFRFFHEETPNGNPNATPPESCPYGGDNGQGVNENGCADRVTFQFVDVGSTPLLIENELFILSIAGFQRLDDEGNPIGPINPIEFLTTEQQANQSRLFAQIEGPGQAIPEPASLALLGAGLAGLGVFARRRRLI